MIVCKFVLPTGGVCNFENADDAEWCGNCGEKLEWYGEKVVQTEPERVAVVPDEEEAGRGGLIERVKSAFNSGGDDASRGTVTTGVEDAPIVIPEASPSSPAPADTGGRRDAGTAASPAPHPDAPAGASSHVVPSTDQPKATVPTEEKGAAKPVVKRPKPPKPKPGDLICGACGLPNDPTRNFCSRCGTSLKEAKRVKVPWWRRVFTRHHKAVPLDDTTSGSGRPSSVRAPRPRVKNLLAKLVLFALFGTIIAGFAVPSLRSMAIDWYQSARDFLFPNNVPVNVVSAMATSDVGLCDAAGKNVNAERNHCPFHAFDDFSNTYWAEGAPGPGVHQYLLARFQDPVDPAKIQIMIGADDFRAYARPLMLRITMRNAAGNDVKFDVGDETVRSWDWRLLDKADVQELSLSAQDVKSIKFEIIEVRRGQQFSAAAIRDVEFWSVE
jgi:hypothetical protein